MRVPWNRHVYQDLAHLGEIRENKFVAGRWRLSKCNTSVLEWPQFLYISCEKCESSPNLILGTNKDFCLKTSHFIEFKCFSLCNKVPKTIKITFETQGLRLFFLVKNRVLFSTLSRSIMASVYNSDFIKFKISLSVMKSQRLSRLLLNPRDFIFFLVKTRVLFSTSTRLTMVSVYRFS